MAFQPADLNILQQLQRGNEWLRAVLCTLARRGLAFRQAYPLPAQYVIQSITGLPYYKGAQFLFDLMEWEDFMLDGPPPPVLDAIFNAPMSQQLKAFLSTISKMLSAQFGGNNQMNGAANLGDFTFPEGELPPLDGSIFLFQEVILGLMISQMVQKANPETAGANAEGELEIALNPQAAMVIPGEQTTVQITLINRTPDKLAIHLKAHGIPPEWCSLSATALILAAGESCLIDLIIQTTPDPYSLVHLYSYEIEAAPVEASTDEKGVIASGTLLVQSFGKIRLDQPATPAQNGSSN